MAFLFVQYDKETWKPRPREARGNRSSGAILAAAEQHSLSASRGAQARMADMLRRSLIDRTTKKKSPNGAVT